MIKELNGKELADFIKERQAKQVRALRQAEHVIPHLAIVTSGANDAIKTYMRMKRRYGEDILIDVTIHNETPESILETVVALNADAMVHGIIVQLPLADGIDTNAVIAAVAPEKDVDGLGEVAHFDAATPMAINWLLAGYNVSLEGKKIAIVGHGRLVGAPLAAMWRRSKYDITVYDETNSDKMEQELKEYDIIVTATGVPRLIKSQYVKHGAIVVDAGTASEQGVLVGDVADDVRERNDIQITPMKGGVGPLTVTALFDNVIRAARATVAKKSSS